MARPTTMTALATSSFRVGEALERFDAALRNSGSATAVLAGWIAKRNGERRVDLSAHVRSNAPGALSPAMLERMEVDDPRRIAYRRVWLAYGGRVFSIAENWYAPERLSAGMNVQLANDALPFGKVVEPLKPTRDTLFSQWLWRPGDGDEGDTLPLRMPPTVLRHAALVRKQSGEPICEVNELYTRNIVG